MKSFDPTKPVQTRDGRKVRILCTDHDYKSNLATYSIVGIINGGSPTMWTCSGEFVYGQPNHASDLVNIPEPKKLRPWRPEEVPMPCVLRTKNGKTRWQILSVSDYGVGSSDSGSDAGVTIISGFDVLLECNEYSTDGCVTWHPCGVES